MTNGAAQSSRLAGSFLIYCGAGGKTECWGLQPYAGAMSEEVGLLENGLDIIVIIILILVYVGDLHPACDKIILQIQPKIAHTDK